MVTEKASEKGKLVSVICRTVGRPELTKALESIASQNYPHIELVLVNATKINLSVFETLLESLNTVMVYPEQALKRSDAANAGLEAASGDYLMFLDDDDWIATEHITNLVTAIKENEEVKAVYSSAQKTDCKGNPRPQIFNQSFSRAILRRDNLFPIHAMLFERSLLALGSRFDESLAIYEDWDFWIQLSQHTDFKHIDKLTAFYREGGDSGTAVDDDSIKFSTDSPNALARELVLDKWVDSWSGRDVNQMLATLHQSEFVNEIRKHQEVIEKVQSDNKALNEALNSANKTISKKAEQLEARDQQITDLQELLEARDQQITDLQEYQATLKDKQEKLQDNLRNLTLQFKQLQADHEELDRGVRKILNSFSWKAMAPYRFIGNRIKEWVINPVKKSVRTTVIKLSAAFAGLQQRLLKKQSENSVTGASDQVSTIFCGLDSPSDTANLFSDHLTVQGWGFSTAGEVSLRVEIDGLEYLTGQPEHARPDVVRVYAGIKQAENCGFFMQIPLAYLSSGKHVLNLYLEDGKNQSVTLEQEFYSFEPNELYQLWLKVAVKETQQNLVDHKADQHINLVVRLFDDISGLAELLDSLSQQTYAYWQLFLVRDGQSVQLNGALKNAELKLGNKIKMVDAGSNWDACFTDEQLLLFLDAKERLLPHSLAEFANRAQNDNADLIYSDHDVLDEQGQHIDPVFTFGWSPDHLLSKNYVGDVFLTRCGHLPSNWKHLSVALSWRYRLLLEFIDMDLSISRIPKILWSAVKEDRDTRKQRLKQEENEITNYLQNKNLSATVSTLDSIRLLKWELEIEPKVSIIIPTLGKLEVIKPCIETVIGRTAYENFELIILDNSRGNYPEGIDYLKEKDVKLVECDEDFNWARLNNIGARHAGGDLLLFLNDDIEIINKHWLTELVRHGQRDEVGAVGALLLYPSGEIQHAGVFLVNYGGGGLHLFRKMWPGPYVFQQLHKVVREVSANTGACLLLSRKKFEELDGFDETLAVVGNDVDFCLRLIEKGYRNIWTPQCSLIHHESISRSSNVPKQDEEAMWNKWRKTFQAGDQYYNPNLSLNKLDCSHHIDYPASRLLVQCESLALSQSPETRQVKPGVNLVAYIRAEMGLGEGARADARALEAADIDFGILNFELGNPGRMADLSWQAREVTDASFNTFLIHVNGDFLATAKRSLPTYFYEDRYVIAYWAWELEELPEIWISALEEADEIWVPSEFVARAVRKHASIPVTIIPHCIDLSPSKAFSRQDLQLPAERFLFLSMFDTRSIAERKNPFAAIKAFQQAFAPDDGSVGLVLKVNNADAINADQLQYKLQDSTNIFILDEAHTREEINSLLTQINCYVSLHRSEGFGLGPAESMCLGKPTIMTNWSGNTDFMTADNCVPVDYRLIPIERDYGPYKAGQRWADANIDEAAAAMYRLASDPELVDQLGNNARKFMQAEFSPAAVGERIKARLQALNRL
ncbi:MAG: glycosyltransferase [Gammaproteobacteria bacterium]|jgi:GT2 family glycosyltransferase/glycosyltransferase involved in cell wall biosynthesis|nr:glycosyltransferase [Gammaproteobacteria bacterium]|tara:strand:- start:861 stop:5234 length:4374 start_codon:yes stop_codon:yes gene_type:complete